MPLRDKLPGRPSFIHSAHLTERPRRAQPRRGRRCPRPGTNRRCPRPDARGRRSPATPTRGLRAAAHRVPRRGPECGRRRPRQLRPGWRRGRHRAGGSRAVAAEPAGVGGGGRAAGAGASRAAQAAGCGAGEPGRPPAEGPHLCRPPTCAAPDPCHPGPHSLPGPTALNRGPS